VLDQTFGDFELIVVDDGSTDDTKTVVFDFDDSRIKYVFQENKELSAARNKGAKESSGKYICYLDDDDEYLKQHLEILNNEIRKNKSLKIIYRTGLITRSNGTEKAGILWNGRLDRIKFIWDNFIGNTTFCFPIEVFSQYQFPEEFLLFEDKHFLVRALLAYELVQINAHTVIYNYNENSRSVTAYKKERLILNQIECINDLFTKAGGEIRSHLSNAAQNDKIATTYLQAAYQALRNNDLPYAKKYFMKAFSISKRPHFIKSYLAFSFRYLLKWLA
jgi:glycosyltransferase involved in cell wall biosynthesis